MCHGHLDPKFAMRDIELRLARLPRAEGAVSVPRGRLAGWIGNMLQALRQRIAKHV